MQMQVKVRVVDLGRRFLAVRWTDPDTGRPCQKTTKTTDRREADRIASDLEEKINAGADVHFKRIGWEDFRIRFEAEKMPFVAANTVVTFNTVFNIVERMVRPVHLADITAGRLSALQAGLAKEGKRPATICCYLRHLRAALNWAKDIGILLEVPKFRMPRQPKSVTMMRGRPLTDDEFQAMLEAVPAVVRPGEVDPWRFFLRGLWASGLRLAESLEVYWDRPDKIQVDFSGEFPMLRILAEYEKGRKNRLLPITPEFAEVLETVPVSERGGPVFFPEANGKRHQSQWYSKVAAKIGKQAEIVVSHDQATGKIKHAGLHDLRRSFAQRWAQRVLPQQLMEMMRHESIETTLQFYVGINADLTARSIWGHSEPRTGPKTS